MNELYIDPVRMSFNILCRHISTADAKIIKEMSLEAWAVCTSAAQLKTWDSTRGINDYMWLWIARKYQSVGEGWHITAAEKFEAKLFGNYFCNSTLNHLNYTAVSNTVLHAKKEFHPLDPSGIPGENLWGLLTLPQYKPVAKYVGDVGGCVLEGGGRKGRYMSLETTTR